MTPEPQSQSLWSHQLCPLEGVGGWVEHEHGEDEPSHGVHPVLPLVILPGRVLDLGQGLQKLNLLRILNTRCCTTFSPPACLSSSSFSMTSSTRRVFSSWAASGWMFPFIARISSHQWRPRVRLAAKSRLYWPTCVVNVAFYLFKAFCKQISWELPVSTWESGQGDIMWHPL